MNPLAGNACGAHDNCSGTGPDCCDPRLRQLMTEPTVLGRSEYVTVKREWLEATLDGFDWADDLLRQAMEK